MLCRTASKWVARFGWQVPFCRLLDNGILSRLTDTRFILKLELEEVLRMQAFDRWRLADKSRLPITGTIFACNRRSAQIGLGWVSLFEHTDIVPIVGGHLDLVVEPHVTVNLPVVQRAVAASYA
jgi:thioesterase domain-containing protein